MKKLLFGAIAAVVLAQPAMAQDSENLDVWKRNKGITLSYITHQSLKFTDSEIPLQYDSKSGFSFSTVQHISGRAVPDGQATASKSALTPAGSTSAMLNTRNIPK